MPDAAADLVAHARESSVVVIGAGLAGLVAARECAKVGLTVTLLEQSTDAGGLLAAAEIAGHRVDTVADGFSTAPGALADLIDELGLRPQLVPAADLDTWVAGPHGVAPLPRESVLGIPANPFADRTRRILGWAGAWRAYVDRLRPPLTIGKERSLGRLVRSRMGDRVADRMVAPLTVGGYGIAPEQVDVDVAAKGLNTALTRTGSLGGGVAQLLPEDGAPASRATLAGGASTLVDALRAHLSDLDVRVHTGARVAAIAPAGDRWTVALDGDAQIPGLDAVHAVVVCTPEAEARRLLAPHVPALEPVAEGPDDVDVVTLVVDAPALDAHPRGHGVYATRGALAVLHATATWPHTAGEPHVLRVVREPDGSDPVAAALDAARTALGVELGTPLGATVVRAPRAFPASALHVDREAHRAAVAAVPGLGAAGAWLSGGGLAAVVAGAAQEADRIRSLVLWGPGGEDAPR